METIAIDSSNSPDSRVDVINFRFEMGVPFISMSNTPCEAENQPSS